MNEYVTRELLNHIFWCAIVLAMTIRKCVKAYKRARTFTHGNYTIDRYKSSERIQCSFFFFENDSKGNSGLW